MPIDRTVLPMNAGENMSVTELDREEYFVQDGEPLNQSIVNNHLSAKQLFSESATSKDCWVNMDSGGENIPPGGETHQGNTNGE